MREKEGGLGRWRGGGGEGGGEGVGEREEGEVRGGVVGGNDVSKGRVRVVVCERGGGRRGSVGGMVEVVYGVRMGE